MENTIVALATAPLNCAIHIIRVSGPKAYIITNKICLNKIKKNGYTIERNKIVENKQILDDVLLMKFVSPKSFTGEDLIEINCHGGLYLAKKIISLLIKNGCVYATPGEFSKRAFLNRKISIVQAESINNLINSESDMGIKIANNGLNPKATEQLKVFVEELFMMIGQVEVNIDYPEYDDYPVLDEPTLVKKLENILTKLKNISNESKKLIKFISGINVAIVGKPNVGKSSLLNAFLDEEKAIVSNVSGTTRDAIEAKASINGLTINFIDTAGIRNKTRNKIEKLGINKSLQMLEKSDLVLFLVDGSKPMDEQDKEIFAKIKKLSYILVYNKSDLIKKQKSDGVCICAKQKQITPLINEIEKKFQTIKTLNYDSVILQSSTSIATLDKTIKNLELCLKNLKDKKHYIEESIELLKSSYEEILQIIGDPTELEFIEKIFSKFCLGK
ncbi:MAG: tRNA uridine-5-carboxymethylaminomethyl(34) synthesis GTPase MnmE [Mycoplasmataceae bacterium]|jgi:tRNA modification GTPase|nr:tRNA uridine-5-carboxymethylaminomethyl(34) synthesis GTPase MnmE [Mycoplasmataceae bacterium]